MFRKISFTKLMGLVLVLALTGPLGTACAKQPETLTTPQAPRLAPETQHLRLDQVISRLLASYHYRQSDLDDHQSSAILDAYLDALDFNRAYFLASDIRRFEKYRNTLDDDLRAGRLDAAYAIFNVYQQRMVERTAHGLAMLDEPVDFNVSESLVLDRKEAPWAESQAELDELWRKRLKHELLNLTLAGKTLDEARETLTKRYEVRLHRVAQTTSEDVFQSYMNAVSQSFDPHSAYLSPRTSENFNIQMRLSLEGIGAVLRSEDEQTVVVSLVPGGPADLSKQIQPNDKIVAVGQGDGTELVDVVGWRLDDVVDLIRGPRDSVVRLRVLPDKAGADAAGKEVRLVRNKIQLEEQAAKSEIRTLEIGGRQQRIGIITVPTFYIDFAAAQRGDSNYRSTTRDVRQLLLSLKQQVIDGLIIDLRQNGGGALQEAIELTGLFIEDGPVVQVRDSRGDVDVEKDPDPEVVYTGPLAVMVDRFSASASEIFAGAIQDYGRGIVIGEQTFGKGTVQTLIDLNRFVNDQKRAGQLKLTVAKFYRVSGSSTQHRGVIPDLTFPSAYDAEEVGESAQEFALPWDEIIPTRYQTSSRLDRLIPDLKARHQQRLADDPAFQLFMEELTTAKDNLERSSVSLMESERRAERDRIEAKELEWENRRRLARGLPSLKSMGELPEDEIQDHPDLLLEESVKVMGDLIALLNGGQQGTVVMTLKDRPAVEAR